MPRGRPPRNGEAAKQRQFRATDSEWAGYATEARRVGMTRSDWIRLVLGGWQIMAGASRKRRGRRRSAEPSPG
jgi:hypothetical protein